MKKLLYILLLLLTPSLALAQMTTQQGGTGSWVVDPSLPSGISAKSSGTAATSIATGTFSTTGLNDVIITGYGDENTNPSTLTAVSPFSLIQFDGTHYDGQEAYITTSAQTSITSGFTLGTASNTWVLYTVAFYHSPVTCDAGTLIGSSCVVFLTATNTDALLANTMIYVQTYS